MVAPELHLKDQGEEELILNLLNQPEWTLVDQQIIGAAYELAGIVHADDTHSGKPYVCHLLRVANRVTGYLGQHDPELVMAALLHDSVEDHPDTIITTLLGEDAAVPEDLFERKDTTLQAIADIFSPRTASIVGDVSNDPDLSFAPENYEANLVRYYEKVKKAIMRSPEAAIINFCDWNDNALSIIYETAGWPADRVLHGKRKYGPLTAVFRERFTQPEMLAMFSPAAIDYILQQLDFADERLALAA